MIWRRLATTGLAALAAAACMHTYTPDELVEEEIQQQQEAREEEKYDEQIGEAGGENAEGLRRTGDMVVIDSER